MIHRAVYGSLERFLAILIDHFNGKWPFWISPRQAVIIPVSDKHIPYAQECANIINAENQSDEGKLIEHKFYIDIDSRKETVGTRIKESVKKGYTYIIMIGDKELEAKKVAIRHSSERTPQAITPQETRELFIDLENNYK